MPDRPSREAALTGHRSNQNGIVSDEEIRLLTDQTSFAFDPSLSGGKKDFKSRPKLRLIGALLGIAAAFTFSTGLQEIPTGLPPVEQLSSAIPPPGWMAFQNWPVIFLAETEAPSPAASSASDPPLLQSEQANVIRLGISTPDPPSRSSIPSSVTASASNTTAPPKPTAPTHAPSVNFFTALFGSVFSGSSALSSRSTLSSSAPASLLSRLSGIASGLTAKAAATQKATKSRDSS